MNAGTSMLLICPVFWSRPCTVAVGLEPTVTHHTLPSLVGVVSIVIRLWIVLYAFGVWNIVIFSLFLSNLMMTFCRIIANHGLPSGSSLRSRPPGPNGGNGFTAGISHSLT